MKRQPAQAQEQPETNEHVAPCQAVTQHARQREGARALLVAHGIQLIAQPDKCPEAPEDP